MLNAYVTVTARPRAPRSAGAAGARARRGRCAGIPIAHKDLFETKGVRTTAGSLLFEDYIPESNAAIVQQLEDAGAVLLGKTNTHELGGGVTTINPFFGTTRNPVDRTRIPGGSSGGSAAAVVAHLCAAATGSDTGGSVRIPAAFCGCVGFKPTFGRISTQGLIGASPTFDHVGFLTRTVEDAQIMFRAFGGGTVGRQCRTAVRVGVADSYFFDDLEPTSLRVHARIDHMAIAAHVSPTSTSPSTTKTMARVFDPVVRFRDVGPLRRRLADQSRIVFERVLRLLLDRRAHRSPNTKPRLAALEGVSGRRRQALRFAST